MLNYKRFVAVVAILSLVTTNFISVASAASLSSAKDTLSNSDLGAIGTHEVDFTTHSTLTTGQIIDITLPGTPTIATTSVGCPGDAVPSVPSANVARCTVGTQILASAINVTIDGIQNPATAGSQTVNITTKTVGAVATIETANVMIAIIDNIDVSATVPSTLTFTVAGLASGIAVNKATTTVTSSSTALAFGNLQAGTSSIMGQELAVTTNASAGFTVTVQQNQKLTSSGGSTISTFKDDTAATEAWASPSATLDQPATYGHFGLTSNDWSMTGGVDTFKASTTEGTAFYAGLNNTDPMPVMYSSGVANGIAPAIGKTQVAYRLQISALQPAGDYSNILTYVATPTY